MKVINRLFVYFEHKGIKPTPFEASIGLSNGYLRKQLQRNADIGESIVLKIIENCPDINPLWLLTGEESMLKNDSNAIIKEPNESYITKKSPTKKGIPLIPHDAIAGQPVGESFNDYALSFYSIPEFNDRADFIIPVRGPSMAPTYESGDLVACKRIENRSFLQWGKVYVLDTNQGALIKRVHKATEDDCIALSSDNPAFPTFNIHLSDIRSIAIVIGGVWFE